MLSTFESWLGESQAVWTRNLTTCIAKKCKLSNCCESGLYIAHAPDETTKKLITVKLSLKARIPTQPSFFPCKGWICSSFVYAFLAFMDHPI